MPSVQVHCAISRERTKGKNFSGREFRELHEWIDAPQKEMGINHRTERHSFNLKDKNYIQNRWDEKAVVEWLFHIAIDNLETANKFANNIYSSSYDKVLIEFKGKKIHDCEFVKVHPHSETVVSYREAKRYSRYKK